VHVACRGNFQPLESCEDPLLDPIFGGEIGGQLKLIFGRTNKGLHNAASFANALSGVGKAALLSNGEGLRSQFAHGHLELDDFR
jgi:hypothetical protein